MSATDRIDAIRARLDAATPGPWVLNPAHAFYGVMVHNEISVIAELSSKHQTHDEQVDNGSLIANAPADLAFLLAELADRDHHILELRGYIAAQTEQLATTQARAVAAEARPGQQPEHPSGHPSGHAESTPGFNVAPTPVVRRGTLPPGTTAATRATLRASAARAPQAAVDPEGSKGPEGPVAPGWPLRARAFTPLFSPAGSDQSADADDDTYPARRNMPVPEDLARAAYAQVAPSLDGPEEAEERFNPDLPPADPHTDPYDEDGYCGYCGNGRWKYHGAWCEWADAVDALAGNDA